MIVIQVYDIQRLWETSRDNKLPKLLDHVELKMPANARIKNVIEQYGLSCIVAMIDTSGPTVPRKIIIRGNGDITDVCLFPYIGSLLTDSGHKLIHYFDGGDQHADQGQHQKVHETPARSDSAAPA